MDLIQKAYGQLPVIFEENRGQTDSRVKFFTRTSDYAMFLAADEVVFSLRGQPVRGGAGPNDSNQGFHQAAVRMRFAGGNQNPRVRGSERAVTRSSYFLGNDPSQWKTNIPNYKKVEYQEVYPGVNLVFYGTPQELEYDFHVQPGADPSQIELAFEGVEGIRLDENHDLVLQTAAGELRQHRPLAYQSAGNGRKAVEASYSIAENKVRFELGPYDPKKPLIIDPKVTYLTYLGGSGDEHFSAFYSYYYGSGNSPSIAADAGDNVYIAGGTYSSDFPVVSGSYQTGPAYSRVFVSKLNATGTALVYSAVFGGSYSQLATGIALDSAGNAYVTGYTESYNFPVTSGVFQPVIASGADTFVTKLNASGTALLYSTYLGGSGYDTPQGIAISPAGETFVVGQTTSNNFPMASAYQPTYPGTTTTFVSKLNANATALSYSTYFGTSGGVYGNAIAVGAAGSAHVTGHTYDPNFPLTSGAYHGGGPSPWVFVTKFNPAGSTLAYSALLGGSATSFGIDVGSDGAAYVTGSASSQFTTTGGPQNTFGGGNADAFVAKLNRQGSALDYATFLGGVSGFSFQETGKSIAVDRQGNVSVTGLTQCVDFPQARSIPGASVARAAAAFQSMNGGQNWTANPLSGPFTEVRSITYDAQRPGVVFAGAGNSYYQGKGGIYRSSDHGLTWTLLNSTMVGATVITDPSNANVLYALRSYYSLAKSTDGGATWTGLNVPCGAQALKVHPSNSSILYVVSYCSSPYGGVYKSVDGGATWAQMNTGLTLTEGTSLAMDPANPDTLYFGAYGGKLFQSLNAGASWSELSLVLNPSTSVSDIVVNPASPNVLYVAAAHIYKSTDFGATWADMTPTQNYCPAIGCVYRIIMDRSNPETLYVMNNGVLKSTNGAGTWSSTMSAGLPRHHPYPASGDRYSLYDLAVDPFNSSNLLAGTEAQFDAFLTRINAAGTAFTFSTCLGGKEDDAGLGLALGSKGKVFLAGMTVSPDLPVTPGALQPSLRGGADAFVTQVDLEIID